MFVFFPPLRSEDQREPSGDWHAARLRPFHEPGGGRGDRARARHQRHQAHRHGRHPWQQCRHDRGAREDIEARDTRSSTAFFT